MQVYVETNFVLELALLQEQSQACDAILELAKLGQVELFIPAYSLIEPYEALMRIARRRQSLAEAIRAELNQLGRSAPYGEQAATLNEISKLFGRSRLEVASRLRTTILQLTVAATTIPLHREGVMASLELQDKGFSPQDAVVYASVLANLDTTGAGPKVFLNRNFRDFDKPQVHDALLAHDCRLMFSFPTG